MSGSGGSGGVRTAGESPTLTTTKWKVTAPAFGTGSGVAVSCAATRSTQGVEVQVSPDTVVTSVFVLFVSLISGNALSGSMVAVRCRSSGAPSWTAKVAVMTVLSPAGMSPVQSMVVPTGAPQLNPLDPSAPTRVT